MVKHGIDVETTPYESILGLEHGLSVPPVRGDKLADTYSFARTLAECDHSFFRACKSLESNPKLRSLWQAMVDFEEHFLSEITLAYIDGLTLDMLQGAPSGKAARKAEATQERWETDTTARAAMDPCSALSTNCTDSLSRQATSRHATAG